VSRNAEVWRSQIPRLSRNAKCPDFNPNEALKGREVMTEVFDGSGVFLSTSFATLTNRRMLTGLDGRSIHYAFVSETNELRYDTEGFASSGTPLTLESIRNERISGAAIEPGSTESRTIAVRSANGARIRTTFDEIDLLGQVREQTAHGQVGWADGSAVDGVIVSHSEPVLVNDEEWIWRTGRSWVTGPWTSETLGDTTNEFNERGDLVASETTVTSPSTYDFSGDSSGEGSALAYTQSNDPIVSSTLYDVWGNTEMTCAGADISGGYYGYPTACLRMSWIEHDAQFAQVVLLEHIRVSATEFHQYFGSWDRGLGVVTSATDPNYLTTVVTYDGRGLRSWCAPQPPTSLPRGPLHVAPRGATLPLTSPR
jgi:hypothetical protein